MKKDILYAITCLTFSIMVGGAVYEHLCVVPSWSAAPPLSLSMFQGEYGLKAETFWMLIHPVNLLLFSASLAMCWRTQRKKSLIIVLAGYISILIITAIYFVPELLTIVQTPFSTEVDPDLTRRAKLWEVLSIIRMFVLFALTIVLYLGLTRAGTRVPSFQKRNEGKQRSAKQVMQLEA